MDNQLETIRNIRARLVYHQISNIFWYTDTRRALEEDAAWEAFFESEELVPPTAKMLATIADTVRTKCKSVNSNLLSVIGDDYNSKDGITCKPILDGPGAIAMDHMFMEICAESSEACHSYVSQITTLVKEAEDAVAKAEAQLQQKDSFKVTKEQLNDKRNYPLAGKFAAIMPSFLSQYEQNVKEKRAELEALQWLIRQLKLDAGPEDMETLCGN